MPFEEFSVDDFLKNDFFLSWARNENPEADDFWKKWMKNHPERVTYLLQAKQIVKSFKYQNTFDMSEKEYTKVFENILKQRESNFTRKNTLNNHLLKMAAAVAILVTAIGVWFYAPQNQNVQDPLNYIVKTNPPGQKSTFQLLDGSVITLNSGSTLKFPDNFSDDERKVFLEGEAFFNVNRDTLRPFIVVTKKVQTTVLGTSFNIKVDNPGWIEVALVEGSVAVKGKGGNEIILTPNERVVFSDKGMKKSGFTPEKVIGWVYGNLIFDRATAPEVIRRLEQWYGVTIVSNKHEIFQGHYSGEFDNETLEHVLAGIGFASGFTYEIKGKKVFIN